MRKLAIIFLFIVCAMLFYLTAASAGKVFRSDWQMPRSAGQATSQYRLVLITQELGTPFWNKVGEAASKQALADNASLEVWGSYTNNHDEFLKKIEIAIYSRVDGIIVQGLDTDEFKELTKIKASSYGIPVLTVGNDIPMDESLRKTYVGSNQYEAGQMIANQLVADMGTRGEVVLMFGRQPPYYQKQRREGIKDVLKDYPSIRAIEAVTGDAREQAIASTRDLMNRFPEAAAFIAVDAKLTGAMVQEIESRSKVEPYYLYSFGDNAESTKLLSQGKLDAIIEQSPEEMGKLSVDLIIRWMENESIPLDINGYHTDITVVKAKDEK